MTTQSIFAGKAKMPSQSAKVFQIAIIHNGTLATQVRQHLRPSLERRLQLDVA